MRKSHEERIGDDLRKTLRYYYKPPKQSSMLKKKPKTDLQIEKNNYIDMINPEVKKTQIEIFSKFLRDPFHENLKSVQKDNISKETKEIDNEKMNMENNNFIKFLSSGSVKINPNSQPFFVELNTKKLLCHKLKKKLQMQLLNKKKLKENQLTKEREIKLIPQPPKVNIPLLELDDDIPEFSLESNENSFNNIMIGGIHKKDTFNIHDEFSNDNLLNQRKSFSSSSKLSILKYMKKENAKKVIN